MALDIAIPFISIEEENIETSRTYYIDWENGRITGLIDGIEAIKQFVKKALITPRFKCLLYDGQYGSDIRNTLIAHGVTKEYIETEIHFLIEDALIHDNRILRVYNITISFGEDYPSRDSTTVSFDVDTIFGRIPVREAV